MNRQQFMDAVVTLEQEFAERGLTPEQITEVEANAVCMTIRTGDAAVDRINACKTMVRFVNSGLY